MRIALLVLLALNMAAAAWLLTRSPEPEVTPAQTDPGVPLLRLLGEQLAEGQSETAELAAAPEPPSNTDAAIAASASPALGACAEIGPFASQSALRQATAELSGIADIVAERSGVEQRSRGHWVHLPPAGSREGALAIARKLSAAGVQDYYVVTAGDSENTVSLGLFRDLANAERRQQEIAAHGYTALISDRIEDQPVYWLTVAYPGPGPLDRTLAGDPEIRPVACPD